MASQQDSLGRTTRLTSLALNLPAQDTVIVQQAAWLNLETVSLQPNGNWLLQGQFYGPTNNGTIQIQLLDADKSIRMSVDRYLAEDGTFSFELPGYTPAQEGTFLLAVSKQVQNVVIALDSIEVRLSP